MRRTGAVGTALAVVFSAALGAAMAGGCSRSALLQMPPEMTFQKIPAPSVETAIVAGCMRRGWVPVKVRDGVFEATLRLRAHVAVVEILYDADSFRIDYVRTENLHYLRDENGVEAIHPNFNSWVKNLAADILTELGRMGVAVRYPAPLAIDARPAPAVPAGPVDGGS